MLSVGARTLFEEGKQLSLGSILSFLYECYTERPNDVYVGFFLGYDFIQWEKLLPERHARLLLTTAGIESRKTRRMSNPNPYPDPVVWEGWEIDVMAGRRFKLRPHVHHKSQYSDFCRNRTCETQMETADNEFPILVEGEHLFNIPDGNDSDGEEYLGTHDEFWERFGPPKLAVGQQVKAKSYRWMYICDTGSFWQTSFLNVIDPKNWDGNPVCTDEEYQLIKKGKSDRGTVADYNDTSYYEEMRTYNVLENDVLSRVTQRLNEGFMNDRIPIKLGRNEWYGPGRAAQRWMDTLHELCSDRSMAESNRSMGVRSDPGRRLNEYGILSLDCYASVPAWFREAAQSSYYGGWFEQFMHGHVGDVWEYDINSAYPFIIASLPCLHTAGNHNGRYYQGGATRYHQLGDMEGEYTLLHCEVRGSDPYIGAMPHRNNLGNIARPSNVKGWYWLHEIKAAERAGLIDSVEIDEWVSYKPCMCCKPFNPGGMGIESLYQLRLDFGKNTPQGKSAKLVYNSAYGKTAQSIGTPKYSNPIYASLITAGCRTLILDAIASHSEGTKAVSMIATDGIYFTSRHPHLNLSKTELGQWDETYKERMCQLMPGVYWDEKAREAVGLGQAPKIKSRGIAARDLAEEISRLDYLFALQHERLRQGLEYEWPEVIFKVNFLLESAKSALNRGKWNLAGKVTHGSQRRISANPISKRDPKAYRDSENGGCTRTIPYARLSPYESIPYDRSFGYRTEDPTQCFGDAVERTGSDPLAYWRELINQGHVA